MLKDATGRLYELNQYVFCAVMDYKKSKVSPFCGKVTGIGKAITVVKYINGGFKKVVLNKPENHIIMPDDVAILCTPELKEYVVEPEVCVQYDILGVEYKTGDYVFIATHYSNSSVRTSFAKVIKVNKKSITVMAFYASWRDNPYVRRTLKVPNRHLIVPEEIARRKDPEIVRF